MEVSSGAMSPVLRKLGELLLDEYNLGEKVKKGVKSLHTELELMHAALRKVGDVPSDQLDEQVLIWAGKVRDLSYEMEDVVDDFLVRVDEGSSSEPMTLKSRVKKFVKKASKLFSKGRALHQISDAIQEARDLAKELAELHKRYQFRMPSTNNGATTSNGVTIDPRVIALHKDVEKLVGIDRARNDLIKILIGEDGSPKEQLTSISIVGVGGLGKTTLTKAVYEKIKAQFDCAAFVPVGQKPDIKKVFKDILFGLDKEKFKDVHNTTRDENLLIEEIGEFLVDKRYLIVIDDIWEEETWRYINCALYKNNHYSRVVTTTRNMNVSEACASAGDDMIYKMKPLSFEDSEVLFHRRIFQSEEKCPHDLLVVSTEILKKCGGVPLAIITIASLLASKQEINEKDEWLHLLASIGRGVTEDAILKDMKRILSLSYYDLSSHLKSCLLYLSIFPEDFMIEKDWLIWMWIAEGFIQCDKEESRLFKIGEHYFNELINRSLIQPTLINGEGMVVACQIHDMVLDLICSLSAEEKFVSILDRAERHASNLQWKVRRLSLHNSKAKFPNHRFDITSLSKLRSFVVFSPATCDWLPSLSSLQFLRVLDLGNCGGHESISCISLKYVGNLLHLRYLGLKNADVHELPVDIGKLQLLQTIDIEGTRIEKLPASVVHLTHLKCLCVDKRTRLPKGMGILTSLEVLKGVNISLSPHIVKELSELTKVWMLSIDWSEMDVDLTNVLIKSLGNLLKLQILEIWNGGRLIDLMREGWMLPPHLHKFESWGNWSKCDDLFLRLPKWIHPTSLPVLSSLIIDVEELRGGDIQIIGMLPALRFLWLGAVRVMGKLVVGADSFTSARECRFKGFPMTPCLFPPGAMPRLQRLRFEVSAQLIASGEVDCGMVHLPLLELVWAMLQDDNSSYEHIGKAKAVLRGAANAHPKNPIMVIIL